MIPIRKLKTEGFSKIIDGKKFTVGQEITYLGFDAYISGIDGGCVSIVYKNISICKARVNERSLNECLSYSL